ncbi:hypothetical protein M0D68_14430 [Paraburkholderia sp. SEWSISQ10-3 4]|uniref:DUF7689 domain-containing protein n=1 Tax=Paraburkholderia TaxID=1822464 RepID=UPI002255AA50|nr:MULTISPECIES: hypothetical protein [Paraburkholderia]MCX4139389.1 hypothetical protein [Paraburkholderia aspalathi]MDN7172076.1 hypothetical protein [Paraburkholderia sp. SEWSISQ10-3 4]MDQ6501715.1 hypothetical protein [Paraburkholderia aspalathi]
MYHTGEQLDQICAAFPAINRDTFAVTSPQDPHYNCIAWAADENDVWWWPSPDAYWPDGLPLRDESVQNFTAAFETIGYLPCDDGSLEEGYEKVVIYSVSGMAKHMARQLPDGAWTSKLGKAFDVRHGADLDVSGEVYGECTHYMRRRSA